MTHSGENVIVVGASSGMGEAIAKRLAADGCRVALLARREAELQRVAREIDAAAGRQLAFPYVHDAAAADEVEPLFQRIEQDLGDVAGLYYAAGIMPEVGLDEFDTAKDREQFAVNTIGSVAWVNAAARRFLRRRRGTIVGVSSVAGDRGRMGRPAYCASKAAMDCHLEAIRNRLWRHGVVTTTIRPGFVLTPMTAHLRLKGAITAERAAELIVRAARKRKAVAYVPAKWRPIMTVIRLIPSSVFRKLSI
jgi:NAD(P)-dependent dehydrogenase (short-subunit alcohol dehydrogenase family)